MNDSLFTRLQRRDRQREGIPGEHWLTLGAGLWLLSRRSPSPLGRGLALVAGTALVVRAATGRDGIAKLLRHRFWRRSDRQLRRRLPQRYIDIAAPWPYDKRVRVAAISEPIGRSGSAAAVEPGREPGPA